MMRLEVGNPISYNFRGVITVIYVIQIAIKWARNPGGGARPDNDFCSNR
jgi:hypothetical protein